MATSSDKPPDTYSPSFAFMYIFNLIVGVGALSLPRAFSEAGLVLGTLLIIVLAAMSYLSATFMIEAMAIANAYDLFRKRKSNSVSPALPNIQDQISPYNSQSESESDSSENDRKYEKSPLLAASSPSISSDKSYKTGTEYNTSDGSLTICSGDYEITNKFEMGTIANLFYNPIGIILYYIIICLYLYGDLAIYLVAIPKSVVTVVCTKPTSNDTISNHSTGKFDPHAHCVGNLNQQEAYYIFLAGTALLLFPWTFFNLTRSKHLQLVTTIMRNIAFALMVGIAIAKLAQGNLADPGPKAASFYGFPVLFGVSIYSFMCQHSLPGMITPMRTKRGVFVMVFADFSLILMFYLLLAYTGAFLFTTSDLYDLYTLNFYKPFRISESVGRRILAVLGYYLVLFPVFTLSSNFPIISITLRENLKALAHVLLKRWYEDKPFPFLIDRLVFPLLAVILPLVIAFVTTNVELLVSITGSYPGVFVQYIIPVTLAFAGKYAITRKLKSEYLNKYKSPFSHVFFLVVVIVWTIISVMIIIADDVLKIIHHKFLDA